MSSQVSGILKQPQDHEWCTPLDFYERLHAEFGFTTDAAASDENALCPHYFSRENDAFSHSWEGVVFCNPPYGREIGFWVRYCFLQAESGATVVMLIPARTETHYWHQWVMQAAEIRFIRGRLRFSGSKTNAPFPSAVVVFRPHDRGKGPIVSAMDAR